MELRGIGTAVPAHWIAQDDAAAIAQSFQVSDMKAAGAVNVLYRRSGVRSRHSVVLDSPTNGEAAKQTFYPAAVSSTDRGPALSTRMKRYEQTAADLGLRAARSALATAETDAEEVTHLITASCTGFVAPGFDIEMCATLSLRKSVARTHIGFMGCHAMLNALRVAHAITAADETATVLVCAVELCSLHQQYGSHASRIVSNSLFADGAAAAVCSGKKSSDRFRWRLLGNASTVIPDTRNEMTWKLGDNGFEMFVSSTVPAVIRRELRPWIERWLDGQGIRLNEVGSWAVHPGGPRILDAVEDAIDLSPSDLNASRAVLEHYGNMSSPTVMFVLERLNAMCGEGPCVMLGFGPGLSIEAALLA